MGRVVVRAGRALAAVGAVSLLLTACGGNGEDAAGSPPATGTTSSSVPSESSPLPSAPGNGPGDGSSPPAGQDVPPPGTAITGENISAEHAADLQAEVDEGHEPWRLDQSSVARVFANNRFGWTDVQIALDDPHTVQVSETSTQHLVSLQMRQPVREGETGIWVVDSGVWLG